MPTGKFGNPANTSAATVVTWEGSFLDRGGGHEGQARHERRFSIVREAWPRRQGREAMTIAIDVRGDLDEQKGHEVAAAIRSAAGHTVDLRIDSRGGKLIAAILIALEIEECPNCVVTTVVGEASSAAALVALGGDKRRIAGTGAMMMHFGTFPAGSAISPDERANAAVDMLKTVGEYVPAATQADIRTWMNEERTFRAREAQAAGLVDVISDAPLPLYLRELPKRRPTAWLREYRDLFERLDLRGS